MNFLLVVDMQNDFVTGPLGSSEAQAIIPNVVNKIRQFNGEIGYTADAHSEADYGATQEGQKLPVLHCHSFPGNAIIEEIRPMALDIYPKNAPGCIRYAEHIWKRNYETNGDLTITLIGVCTDICVISTALLLRSYFPKIPITVDAACCAGTTPENHQKALDVMKQCFIDIINEEEHNDTFKQ